VAAWWIYWSSIAVAAVVWIGSVLLGGRDGLRALLDQPIGLVILILPLVVAGLNLIMFRGSHEEVCRLEVQRHRWLRMMTGGGYSARTFLLTGVVLLVLAAGIVAANVSGAI
jgi:hypothetical protein